MPAMYQKKSSMTIPCTVAPWFILVQMLVGAPASDQSDSARSVAALFAVADNVIKSATFDFVDRASGQIYPSPLRADRGASVKIRSGYNDWRYWNGVLNIAMNRMGHILHDSAYAAFGEKNIAFSFNNAGIFKSHNSVEKKWNDPFGQFLTMEELDDCGAMGASLLEIYERHPDDRYLRYIEKAANHIESVQPRLPDGTLVRSFPRKWTLWADDLYMSVSFLCRMGAMTADHRFFDDAAKQVINFHKHLFDPAKGLMNHCWFSDSGRPGLACWGRANGWAMMAQADLLDRLPNAHPLRDTLISLLRRDIEGITKYQSQDGLWHQVLDRQDSYKETSCSAMFTFAIARAIENGYVGKKYTPVAINGWKGVMSRIRPTGEIEGVCAGTGVGEDLNFYFSRPTPLNDPHGIGAVLLAGTAILELRQ